MIYDVVVIGAGVTGAFAARALSKFNLKICIADREADVAMGTSKANSAIVHAGYDAEPGSMKARFNVPGNEMMEKICAELDVPFKRIGSLVLAFEENDRHKLQQLYERGVMNGVRELSVIGRERLLELEPNISDKACAALYAPTAGIVCPYELALGAVENAVENGAELKLECAVEDITYENNLFHIKTNKGELCSRYMVNAAGVYADRISAMVGDNSFSIHPRKGEYILFDKNLGGAVNRVVFQLPTAMGKGILVTPTVDGNLLIGPNAEDIDDREDTSTTQRGLEQVLLGARKSVPSLALKDVVTSFAGLRARPSGDDFIIGPSIANSRLINAAGIESPGLTAAPAIGEYVAWLLGKQGLKLDANPSYTPERRRVIRFRELKDDEVEELIKKDPAYGRIICRCERVTEGEVLDCIRRSAGAGSVDGVKRRTRSGMGRCQGGFCTPRIAEILARELGIPLDEVTKMGGSSRLLAGRVK